MHTLKQNLKLGSLFLATIFVGCSPKFTKETKEGFNLVKNENGARLLEPSLFSVETTAIGLGRIDPIKSHVLRINKIKEDA